MRRVLHEARDRLPPLAARLGAFAGFEDGRRKQEQIHGVLKALARKGQAADPRRFYSVREVRGHFGVALGTVAAVYRRMEREGLLARIRGAGTVLAARTGRTRPRRPVRGNVVVINWLPGFMHAPDQRHFVMQLEKRLWERDYASALMFYYEEEKRDPEFAIRILGHHPDFAIWLTPGPADTRTMETLCEAGVRLVILADRTRPVPSRAPQYILDLKRAQESAFHAWRKAGVDSVVAPVGSSHAGPMEPELGAILNEAGIRYRLHAMKGGSMETYLEGLATQPAGVVFRFSLWSTPLCLQAPRAFARLLAQRRVMNYSSLPIEPRILGDVRTDAVLFPWDRIIDRLVHDLHSGEILRMTRDVTFEAEWKPQIPAAQISRLHAWERVE